MKAVQRQNQCRDVDWGHCRDDDSHRSQIVARVGKSFGISLLYIHYESNCTVGEGLIHHVFPRGLENSVLEGLKGMGTGDEDLLIVTL